ncbi:MAG: DUF2279 domain-containing protein [Flavobacteriales bacterium]|nr:DUF2279 domain-containing protein [Flavobacteriales bacterium]
MKPIRVLFVICALLVIQPVSAATWPSDSIVAQDTVRVNYIRFGGVCVAAASTLGASYIHLQNTWWKETQQGFHFDTGADLKYAVNLDKFGHFFGGVIASDIYSRSLKWCHFSERKCLWYGAGFGVFVQMAIEVKDAFAPRWGFSYWDVISGSVGSLYPVGQHYFPFLAATQPKLSYYKRTNRYFDTVNPHARKNAWNDDYINQTYWLSFRLKDYFGEDRMKWWPAFLGIAAGVGVDEEVDGKGAGNIETYLALDYDLPSLFPKERKVWRTIAHFVNYIKLPAPTLRFTPEFKAYGAFM